MLWCGGKGALESGEKSEKQLRLTGGSHGNEGASEAGKVRAITFESNMMNQYVLYFFIKLTQLI